MKCTCKFQPPLLPQYPRKELEIEAFSYGASAGGHGTGTDFSLERKWAEDGASEALTIACASGKSFHEALLTVYAGGGAVTYALRLKRVVISDYTRQSSPGNGHMSERFTLTAQSTTTIQPN
jgi:type VI protein secretion system component Hcp